MQTGYECGINMHALNGYVPSDAQGFHYVRSPFWVVNNDYTMYYPLWDGLRELGIDIQVVLDRRAFRTGRWTDDLKYLKRKLPGYIKWIQVCNEQDSSMSVPSNEGWPLSVRTCDHLIAQTRLIMGDDYFLTLGGFAHSAGPEYFRKLRNLHAVNAMSIHVYGIRPEPEYPAPNWGFADIDTVHAQYVEHAQLHNLQMEVSEWGAEKTWFANEGDRAAYVTRFSLALARLFWRGAYYALNDRQAPKFGVVRADGNTPYESYAALPGPTVPWAEPELDLVWKAETIAAVTGSSLVGIKQTWPLIVQYLTSIGSASVRSLAAAVGTLAIETANTFMPVIEAFWLSESWRKSNLRYYPFYGRGDIQLTWDYNYRTYGDKIGVNLIDNPELALEPHNAANIFAHYWNDHDIKTPANSGDWYEVRKRVQGGYAHAARLAQIANDLLRLVE